MFVPWRLAFRRRTTLTGLLNQGHLERVANSRFNAPPINLSAHCLVYCPADLGSRFWLSLFPSISHHSTAFQPEEGRRSAASRLCSKRRLRNIGVSLYSAFPQFCHLICVRGGRRIGRRDRLILSYSPICSKYIIGEIGLRRRSGRVP